MINYLKEIISWQKKCVFGSPLMSYRITSLTQDTLPLQGFSGLRLTASHVDGKQPRHQMESEYFLNGKCSVF